MIDCFDGFLICFVSVGDGGDSEDDNVIVNISIEE